MRSFLPAGQPLMRTFVRRFARRWSSSLLCGQKLSSSSSFIPSSQRLFSLFFFLLDQSLHHMLGLGLGARRKWGASPSNDSFSLKKKTTEPLPLWKVSLTFVELERFPKLQHKNPEKLLHPPAFHDKAQLMKTQFKSFRRPRVIVSFLSANK